MAAELPWPSNVWLGVSVETTDQLWRRDDLRRVPAATRFVSAEPLLASLAGIDLTGVHWLIAGGESGPNHRPLDPEWVRELRYACRRQGIAFFSKQWGGRTPKSNGRELDRRRWDEMPVATRA